MKKFGGPGRMKQSCVLRQCLAVSDLLGKEYGGGGVVPGDRNIHSVDFRVGKTSFCSLYGFLHFVPFFSGFRKKVSNI